MLHCRIAHSLTLNQGNPFHLEAPLIHKIFLGPSDREPGFHVRLLQDVLPGHAPERLPGRAVLATGRTLAGKVTVGIRTGIHK